MSSSVPAAPQPAYRLQVRANSSLALLGEVDDYTGAEFLLNWNDVGKGTITLRGDTTQAALMSYGNGIILERNNMDGNGYKTLFSGPITDLEEDGAPDYLMTVTCSDDLFWLKSRRAWPCASPWTASAYDTRTATHASTLLMAYVAANAITGGAWVSAGRAIANLVNDTDPVLGSSAAGSARFDVLLTVLQQIALASSPQLGFRIVQVGGALKFQVYQSTNKPNVQFSEALGNLVTYHYKQSMPVGNEVVVGGSGTGTSRAFVERSNSTSISTYSRIEDYLDARDTNDTATLQQRGDAELAATAAPSSLSVTPIDTPSLMYSRDYNLGDTVTVITNAGTVISDVVRQIDIRLDGTNGDVITPAIGTPSSVNANPSRVYQTMMARLVRLQQQLTQLQIRQ